VKKKEQKNHLQIAKYGEGLFAGIFETAIEAIITISENGIIETFNDAAVKLFGYAPGEVVGKNVKILMPEPYQSEHDTYLANYRYTGKRTIIGIGRDVTGKRKDGTTFPMHLSVSEAKWKGRKVFVGIGRDISDLKLAQEKAETQSSFVEASFNAMYLRRPEGEILIWNAGSERLYGWSQKEIVGKNIGLVISDNSSVLITEAVNRLRKGEAVSSFEAQMRTKKGEIREVLLTLSGLYDQAGNLVSIGSTDIDITENKIRAWQDAKRIELFEKVRDEKSTKDLSQIILNHYIELFGLSFGTLYVIVDNEGDVPYLKRAASYAIETGTPEIIEFGEGLVGQCVLSKKPTHLDEVPKDYYKVKSSLGQIPPNHVLIYPLISFGDVIGVLELASLASFSERQINYLNLNQENLAYLIRAAISREQVAKFLQQYRKQTQELKKSNEELAEKTKELLSEREKLAQTNVQLETQRGQLEKQKEGLQQLNEQLNQSKIAIEQKAQQIETASRYKSEFLANMSHELRTPLNSILLLSKVLSENRSKELSDVSVEHARIIHSSGSDLLNLINDVLDLSKVEVGQLEIVAEQFSLSSVVEKMTSIFKQQLDNKKVDFKINLSKELPKDIFTDQRRLEQILKNLLANALKFTDKGNVTFKVYRPSVNDPLSFPRNLSIESPIAFSISDTGIGIPEEAQGNLFQAFKQVDGSISKKYGGTGLGLNIAKKLAQKLGGEISLTSTLNKGSTFVLFIPEKIPKKDIISQEPKHQERKPNPVHITFEDDRAHLTENDKIFLIIEDDHSFAKILIDSCHKKGLKCLIFTSGEEGMLNAIKYQPEIIALDLNLPDVLGLQVLQQLKTNPGTSSIPVLVVTVLEEKRETALKLGASYFLSKPVVPETLEEILTDVAEINRVSQNAFLKKKILAIDDDIRNIYALKSALSNTGVEILACNNGKEGLAVLQSSPGVELILIDIMMPEMDGYETILKIREINSTIPIIALTAKAMQEDRIKALEVGANDYMVKPFQIDHLKLLLLKWIKHN
jgi:PAS domain S-box-containing protein